MDEYVADNRAHWEEASTFHHETDAYDVEAFLDGESSLQPLEREELGDVAGETLCHLQCHFGLDTLSWAREGAEVTGLDFAEEAIERARELAREAGLADRAEFVCADVYDAPDVLDGRFDVVFTSYGVLSWLPDVERWAEVVAALVAPGGTFYVAEFHPLLSTLEYDFDGETAFPDPYFTPAEPLTFDDEGTYADEDAAMEHATTHFWPHGLGEIITALLDAGLSLEFVREHRETPWQQFPAMVETDDGRYRFADADLPAVVSIKATNPAETSVADRNQGR